MKSECIDHAKLENSTQTVLISSCLYGLKTRYNCTSKPTSEINFKAENIVYFPVCPEQLGGMNTLRPEVMLSGGDGSDVLNGNAKAIEVSSGDDVTDSFVLGAEYVLDFVTSLGISKAYLKSKSPSCGVKRCYIDGELQQGSGVTAALLMKNGIEVEEFDGGN